MTQAPTLGQELWERITDPEVYPASAAASAESDALLSEGSCSLQETRCAVPGGELVVRFAGDPPAWLRPALGALAELLWLPADWDSYGALPVDPAHVHTMLEVLALVMRDDTPVPSVCPTNRGGVQVEWHERGIDLEIETLSAYTLGVSFEDSLTGTEWDREVDADLSPLTSCIADLSSR